MFLSIEYQNNKCNIRLYIKKYLQLKEGRQLAGKIDVKIRLRTPLLETESSTVTESWLVIDHQQSSIPRPLSGQPPTRSPSKDIKYVKPKK